VPFGAFFAAYAVLSREVAGGPAGRDQFEVRDLRATPGNDHGMNLSPH